MRYQVSLIVLMALAILLCGCITPQTSQLETTDQNYGDSLTIPTTEPTLNTSIVNQTSFPAEGAVQPATATTGATLPTITHTPGGYTTTGQGPASSSLHTQNTPTSVTPAVAPVGQIPVVTIVVPSPPVLSVTGTPAPPQIPIPSLPVTSPGPTMPLPAPQNQTTTTLMTPSLPVPAGNQTTIPTPKPT